MFWKQEGTVFQSCPKLESAKDTDLKQIIIVCVRETNNETTLLFKYSTYCILIFY